MRLTLLGPFQGGSSPMHHGDTGAAARFDYVDAIVIALVVAAAVAIGVAGWRMLQRRRFG